MKIHFVTASFNRSRPVPIDICSSHDISVVSYNDANTPSRHLAMHPRLKAKVPKMLEWKNVDADWYVWIDDSLSVISKDLAEDIINCAGENKICLFKHPSRKTILEEYLFISERIKKGDLYLKSSCLGEPLKEQIEHYLKDQSFKDNSLFWMGFFAYHRSVSNLMLDWFLENVNWSIRDQLSFPYVLSKHGLKYSIFEGDMFNNPYVAHRKTLEKGIFGRFIYKIRNIFNSFKSFNW